MGVFITLKPKKCRNQTKSPVLRIRIQQREFAAECMALAQTILSPEKRALYLKMASVWHQMAQRWEKKS